MEYREFEAKTIEDAITEATVALGVPSERLEYEVVEEGSSGLFGMFSKSAMIRARVKEDTHAGEGEKEKPQGGEDIEKALKESRAPEKSANKDRRAPSAKEAARNGAAPAEAGVGKERAEKESAPRSEEELGEMESAIRNFLGGVLEKMGTQASINIVICEEEKKIDVDLEGDTGEIIGKRGATLNALQYLSSIVANKGSDEYYRLKLDTKNYRARREKTLENLADNVAVKVKKTRHKVVLDPMNPYERRIIHYYLQGDEHIVTKSEGEDPNRRVVVYYKK